MSDDAVGYATPPNQRGPNPERECPLCGARVKALPSHLRHQCEVAG